MDWQDLRNWPLMDNNIVREDLDAVIEFLKGDPILTQSTNVKAFEQEWSEWLGVKHGVFVNSGSSANQLTLGVLKELYGPGEVIVPTLTWVSDIASVLQHGFTPVFVDINPRTLGMDIDQVLSRINKRTKAVFLTHILGYNALDQRLLDACRDGKGSWSIPLIEDVCESHGATFQGKRLGSFGWASNFSYYFAHHMSTIEGGMVNTNDPEAYECARLFRSHGMVREAVSPETKARYAADYPDLNPDFIFAYPAYNFRSTEINAVIGRQQLKRLDANNEKRRRNLALFLEHLDPAKYFTEFDQEGASNYAFTLVMRSIEGADPQHDPRLLGQRLKVEATLRERKIEFRRGTSGGGNQVRQPYLRRLFPNIDPRSFPRIEHVHFNGYYIGNYPDLPPDKIVQLCQLLNSL